MLKGRKKNEEEEEHRKTRSKKMKGVFTFFKMTTAIKIEFQNHELLKLGPPHPLKAAPMTSSSTESVPILGTSFISFSRAATLRGLFSLRTATRRAARLATARQQRVQVLVLRPKATVSAAPTPYVFPGSALPCSRMQLWDRLQLKAPN